MTQIAHFSDVHLGYEAYSAKSAAGVNQRGEDVVRALAKVVSDIVAADPPLVICSGDIAETPHPQVKYMLVAAMQFQKLAGIRPDGSRRQLVVIAGNHDQSKHTRDGCFLDLYQGIPGVHVVTSGYSRLTFDEPELQDVVVHALPHDSLRDLKDLDVKPVEGKTNVLTAHGVAESSELYRRAVGREYLIPSDLLLQPWEYVALGHWHTQGPVYPLGSHQQDARAWYAGSVESVDFGDVKGGSVHERGWLLVDVARGELPEVSIQKHPVRSMVNLPVVDASNMSPADVSVALVQNLKSTELEKAVVRQRVVGVPRDIWTLVDTTPALKMAETTLHYRLEPRFVLEDMSGEDDQPRGMARVGGLLRKRVETEVPKEDRGAVLSLSQELLKKVSRDFAQQEAPNDSEAT